MGDRHSLYNVAKFTYAPNTVWKTNSGSVDTYVASDTRIGRLHKLTCPVDLRVERGPGTEVETSDSFRLPANEILEFTPFPGFPSITYSRADNLEFSTDDYVTISLCDYDPDVYVPVTTLISYLNGTFTRASNAIYLTSASSAQIAPANRIRVWYQGDYSYPMFEGNRTNRVARSTINSAYWSSHDSTITNNYDTDPISTTTAARIMILYANTWGPGSPTITSIASHVALSIWVKNTAGSGDQLRFSVGAGTSGPPNGLSFTCTSAWQWGRASGPCTPGTDTFYENGQLNKPTSGDLALGTSDTLWWGAQLEEARFASSTIVTSGSAAARSADSLTFTTSGYSQDACTTGGVFTYIPLFNSTDPASGDEFWLFSFGTDDGIRFRQDGTDMLCECVDGGSVVLASNPLTFDKDSIIEIEYRPSLGELTITGCSGGDGTTSAASFSFSYTNMRMGGKYGGTSEAYGRLSNVRNI